MAGCRVSGGLSTLPAFLNSSVTMGRARREDTSDSGVASTALSHRIIVAEVWRSGAVNWGLCRKVRTIRAMVDQITGRGIPNLYTL